MSQMIPQVKLYRRVAKEGEHAEHGFAPVGDDEAVFNKPTLLCCGGLRSNSRDYRGERHANGYAKLAHALAGYPERMDLPRLDDMAPDIDIVTACYPESSRDLTDGTFDYMKALRNNQPATPSDFARQFAQHHLFPLIQREDGTALPLDTIKHNLRNIQVLAHSYGVAFIQQVGDVLADQLKMLHFTPQQIHDATSQVLVVAAGGITPPATGKASFTTVNILNIDDTEVRNSYGLKATLLDLFHKTDLLVDHKNHPVDASKTMPQQIRGKYYPAKPFNILPIQTSITVNGFEFDRSDTSNQWLACISPPLHLNGLGDIIDVKTLPEHSTSDVRGAFDDSKPPEKDETAHQPISYFHSRRAIDKGRDPWPSEHNIHGSTLRTLTSHLLINGLNNAVKNAHDDHFTPLPSADTLMQQPRVVEYTTAMDVRRNHAAMIDHYDSRLADALSTQRPPPQSQRR